VDFSFSLANAHTTCHFDPQAAVFRSCGGEISLQLQNRGFAGTFVLRPGSADRLIGVCTNLCSTNS